MLAATTPTGPMRPMTGDDVTDGSGLQTTIGTQHVALREQVLHELRRRIVDGVYPPGTRLTEERLAADFGVSRNPVREALRVAQSDGLVTLSPAAARSSRPPTPRPSPTCAPCSTRHAWQRSRAT